MSRLDAKRDTGNKQNVETIRPHLETILEVLTSSVLPDMGKAKSEIDGNLQKLALKLIKEFTKFNFFKEEIDVEWSISSKLSHLFLSYDHLRIDPFKDLINLTLQTIEAIYKKIDDSIKKAPLYTPLKIVAGLYRLAAWKIYADHFPEKLSELKKLLTEFCSDIDAFKELLLAKIGQEKDLLSNFEQNVFPILDVLKKAIGGYSDALNNSHTDYSAIVFAYKEGVAGTVRPNPVSSGKDETYQDGLPIRANL